MISKRHDVSRGGEPSRLELLRQLRDDVDATSLRRQIERPASASATA